MESEERELLLKARDDLLSQIGFGTLASHNTEKLIKRIDALLATPHQQPSGPTLQDAAEQVPTPQRRIDNLMRIHADRSVNTFARAICGEAANYLAGLRATPQSTPQGEKS